jgi:hypothetical protein
VLREIPDCRVDPEDFKMGLGLGWPAAQDMLKAQFAKIFEPELPPTGFLEGVDADLEAKLLEYNVNEEEGQASESESDAETLTSLEEPDDGSG